MTEETNIESSKIVFRDFAEEKQTALIEIVKTFLTNELKLNASDFNDDKTRFYIRSRTEMLFTVLSQLNFFDEFFVWCNENNNDANIIESNAFVIDIYTKTNNTPDLQFHAMFYDGDVTFEVLKFSSYLGKEA